MQQHAAQNPNPRPLYSLSKSLYTISYPSHYHVPNPNTNLSIVPHQPDYSTGPTVHPYGSFSSLAQSHGGGLGFEAYPPHVAYPHHLTTVSSGYYQDPNSVASLHNWSANGVVSHYETLYATGVPIPRNGPGQLVPANANPTSWPNPMVRPLGNNKTWKRILQKTKVVQSVWCEVCKVECNTKEILDKHKVGKKHKKNMNKLKKTAAPPPVASENLMIGPRENPVGKGKARWKADEPLEDLEAKRRKVLEGGAAADAVRTCTECDVVCNSEIVFMHHLQGQKHLATMKKQASGSA